MCFVIDSMFFFYCFACLFVYASPPVMIYTVSIIAVMNVQHGHYPYEDMPGCNTEDSSFAFERAIETGVRPTVALSRSLSLFLHSPLHHTLIQCGSLHRRLVVCGGLYYSCVHATQQGHACLTCYI